MKVEFIKGAAPIGLAYSQGNEADFADAFAMELIDRGYCKMIAESVEHTEEIQEEITEAVEVKPEEIVEEVENKPEEVVEAVVEQPEEVQKAVTKSNRKNK